MASLSNSRGRQEKLSVNEEQQQQQERLVYSTKRTITTSTKRKITKSQSSRELLERRQQQERLVSDVVGSTTLSAGKVDDSIWLDQLEQPAATTIMSPAKRGGAGKQTRLASHDEPLEQSRRQAENNNHNNSNNYNNAKLSGRSLNSPATEHYASKRQQQHQQMVHSTMIGDDEAISQQPQPRTRSQAATARQLRQPHKNYHHYDYYTDSDLTSTNQLQREVYVNQTMPPNHYDDNILLFATEHSTKLPAANGSHPQQVFVASNDGGYCNKESYYYPQQQPHLRHNSHHHHQLPEVGSAGNRAHTLTNKTGKFVNYYPSWRQTQSPTTSHSQNYSFHVPSFTAARLNCRPDYRPISAQQKSRYGSMAPADARAGRPTFSSSLRSQTIAHIPNMVKVRGGAEMAAGSPIRRNNNQADHSEPTTTTTTATTNSSSRTYEDFYERPAQVGFSLTDQRSRGISEGDLLKVHLIHLNQPSFVVDDVGFDNPFKPGTELSWEADMMVRLMKRGYPVQELPVLVETAKQVAREKSSPCSPNSTEMVNSEINFGAANKRATAPADLRASNSKRSPVKVRPQTAQSTALIRRKSSADLSPGKQVWANSLSRAKSMPRFYASPRASSGDSDSIDKLITSIENEMTDLLRDEEEEEEENGVEIEERLKSASLNRIESQARNAKRPEKGEKTTSKVPTTATKNSINHKSPKKLESGKRGSKVSTSSDDDRRALGQAINGKQAATSLGPNSAEVIGRKKKVQDLKAVEKKRETVCCVIQ